MSRLFKRRVRVTIAKPLRPDQLRAESAPINAIVVEELRVVLHVEKTAGSEPNTAEISIYNLGEEARAMVQQKPLFVRLEAGYDGELEQVFVGDLRFGTSIKEGVDWITRLELGDGDRIYRHARVTRSYTSGVKAIDAIKEIARTMELTPRISPKAKKVLDKQYAGGLALSGASHREMTRITQGLGLEWSIQDSQLQILDQSEVREDVAIVISQETGMIGVPELAAPLAKGKKATLVCETLLKPSVKPGNLIKVFSEQITGGLFKTQLVAHDGDNRGSDFKTFMEATPR